MHTKKYRTGIFAYTWWIVTDSLELAFMAWKHVLVLSFLKQEERVKKEFSNIRIATKFVCK